jgi:uncharacterized RDD family membrane protein YckC
MKFCKVTPKPYLKLRSIATLIDYTIFTLLCVLYFYVFGVKTDDGSIAINGFPSLIIPFIWFLYFVVTEAVNQATPGHDICKLKVLKPDGTKITLSEAFKRRICDPLDIWFYGLPAFICISKTEKHQRIGDMLAGTVVAKSSDITETEVTF